MSAARRLLVLTAIFVGLLALAGKAAASGGDYVFVGGSEEARASVRAALERSAFDWDVVDERITIRITRCGCAGARPGEIVLDEDVLTRSPFGRRYAWGLVQHEYAHQVDFLVVEPRERRTLARRLGGSAWCYEVAGVAHDANGCERFATLLAWAYWPSRHNVQRPGWRGASDVTRREFRALVSRLLGR